MYQTCSLLLGKPRAEGWGESEPPAESLFFHSRCPPFPLQKLMVRLNQPQREGPGVGQGWKEGSLDSNKEHQFPLKVRKHHGEGLYPLTPR